VVQGAFQNLVIATPPIVSIFYQSGISDKNFPGQVFLTLFYLYSKVSRRPKEPGVYRRLFPRR